MPAEGLWSKHKLNMRLLQNKHIKAHHLHVLLFGFDQQLLFLICSFLLNEFWLSSEYDQIGMITCAKYSICLCCQLWFVMVNHLGLFLCWARSESCTIGTVYRSSTTLQRHLHAAHLHDVWFLLLGREERSSSASFREHTPSRSLSGGL